MSIFSKIRKVKITMNSNYTKFIAAIRRDIKKVIILFVTKKKQREKDVPFLQGIKRLAQ